MYVAVTFFYVFGFGHGPGLDRSPLTRGHFRDGLENNQEVEVR